jgi:hypothetical protein
MKKTQVALAALAVIVVTLLAPTVTPADTETYLYQGQNQLSLTNEECMPCNIDLSFTVASALAPSSTYTWAENGMSTGNQLDPILDKSFSNFVGLNNAIDPSSIQVSTDNSGNIDAWRFTISSPAFPVPSGTCQSTVSSELLDPSPGSPLPESVSFFNCTDMTQDGTDTVISESDPTYPIPSPSPWTEKTNVTGTMNAPEPSSLILLSIGVALAFVKTRRRANSCGILGE